MIELVRSTGLAIAAVAVLGMLVGAVMATFGAVTRRRRIGLAGGRLSLAGPGVVSVGMGIFVATVGLPWPANLMPLLPIAFGGLLLWAGLRVQLRFASRP